jgi:hypothetical protein
MLMRKIKFSLLAVISSVILLSNISFSQVEDKYSYSDEEYNCLADKKWAIVFEAGTILWNGGDAYKSFTFTCKHHFNKRNGVRFFIGAGGYEDDGNYVYANLSNGSSTGDPIKSQLLNIESGVQYFHYLNADSKIKLSFCVGPYFYINYNNDEWKFQNGNLARSNFKDEWGLGVAGSFCVEYFILDNISLMGEYFLSGTIGKKSSQDVYGSSTNNYSYVENKNSTRYKFDANKMRLGFSVYF